VDSHPFSNARDGKDVKCRIWTAKPTECVENAQFAVYHDLMKVEHDAQSTPLLGTETIRKNAVRHHPARAT
jgi:hypothetical protein